MLVAYSVKIRSNPSLEDVEELLQQSTKKRTCFLAKVTCHVVFEGRAKSKLDSGQRLLLKKRDGAFLIHGPENYQPLNWQPETDAWRVQTNSDELVLEARRSNPEEVLKLGIKDIEHYYEFNLKSETSLRVIGDEKDIQNAIEQDPEIVRKELEMVERELKTPAGYADFLLKNDKNTLYVIEVKRNPDHDAVRQLERYVVEAEEEYNQEVKGILVAPEASENLKKSLKDRGLEFEEISISEIVTDFEILNDSQSGLDSFS